MKNKIHNNTILFLVLFSSACLFSTLSFAQVTTIQVGGTARTIDVYAPSGLQQNRPLVISLHGLNQDAAYQKNQAKWAQVADTAKFVVVYPTAINLSWDISGNRDVNFILAIIDAMDTRFKIDRSRVYVTGFSMGGMMSYHTANSIADKIAAIGPVSGYLFGNVVSSSRPMPIIHVHGTTDDVVGYSGVAAIIQKWRNWNQCPSTGTTTKPYPANKPSSAASMQYWGPCDKSAVALITLDGKGHWHSNDAAGVHTTVEIWNFLRKYSLTVPGPAISFTSPADNASFTSGTPITLSVNATSSDGTVSNVKFYDGNVLLNTDNASPYTFTWDNASVGTHQVRAVATDNQGRTSEAVITIRVNVPQSSYKGTPHAIPGTIQLEEYDLGGNGSAYLDNTPGSETTVDFRTNEDVDIENCTDTGGGYNIGYATAGEWLEYTVDVQSAGIYKLDLRVACNGTGRTVSVSMDGTAIAGNIAIPNTGGWQTWQTVSVNNIALTAGQKVMRITIGATDYVNLNFVSFATSNNTPVVSIATPSADIRLSAPQSVALSATASDPDGSITQVEFYNGTDLLGTDETSPYSFTWTNIQPGKHTITAKAIDNEGATATSDPVVVFITAPYNGTPLTIPGRIEAEEYDLGGEGVAYHEMNENGNEGGSTFRDDEVDVETTQDTDGSYNVGYILQGEWLEYSINVLSSGSYDLDVRVASDGAGKTFHIEIDGVDVSGPVTVPNTGGWQTWATVNVPDINLTEGKHQMRIVFDASYFNLNYVQFSDVITGIKNGGITSMELFPNPFSAEGIQIRKEGEFTYRITDLTGVSIVSGKAKDMHIAGADLIPGVYLLTVENGQEVHTYKIIRK